MGLLGKAFDTVFGAKSKSKQTINKTETVTPTNPPWVTDALGEVTGMTRGLASQDPTKFVAGPSDLQTKAWDSADDLGAFNSLVSEGADLVKSAGSTAAPGITAPGNVSAAGAQYRGYDAPVIGATPGPRTQGEMGTFTIDPETLLANLGAYYNQFDEAVIQNTLSGLERDAAMRKAAYAGEGARNKALGGSRFGVGEALLDSELASLRAGTEARLRAEGFDKATNLSMDDTARRQEAGMFNAEQRADASKFNVDWSNQMEVERFKGEMTRALEQAGLSADAAAFAADAFNKSMMDQAQRTDTAALTNAENALTAATRNAELQNEQMDRALNAALGLADIGNTANATQLQTTATIADMGNDQQAVNQAIAGAPLDVLSELAKVYGTLPLDLFKGATSNTVGVQKTKGTDTPSLFDAGSSVAKVIASDGRLKTLLGRVDTLPNGLGWYRFRYIDSETVHEGVIAQEVARIQPEALGPIVNGFMTVDYAKIGRAMV